MEPLLMRGDPAEIGDPVVTDLPLGSVVDIIVTNKLNATIPLYKHNDPNFLLGSQEFAEFKWDSVEEAQEARPDLFNLNDPPMGVVHELPALGWLAIRYEIFRPAMSMFHSGRFRYFVVSSITIHLMNRKLGCAANKHLAGIAGAHVRGI